MVGWAAIGDRAGALAVVVSAGGWGPWGGGFGRFGYGGFGGYGGFNDFDVRTVDRYEASAEILMRRGAPPADEVRAFNARAVVDTVGPSVVLPKAP